MEGTWQVVAARQCGVLSERSLRELGVTRAFVRNQVRAGRWAERTHSVYTTTTGPLSHEQRLWVAVEHAGPQAVLGGLTAAEAHGLRNWARDEVTVLVPSELSFDELAGVRFFRTRRSLTMLRHPTLSPPTCRIEPAVLLFAAHDAATSADSGNQAGAIQAV